MQAYLGTHMLQRGGEEMSRPHPELDRPEWMLNRLSANPHDVGRLIQTRLHRIEDVFMFPA